MRLKPRGLIDENDGKMRAKSHNQHGFAYYHRLSHERGYEHWEQQASPGYLVNQQLVGYLSPNQISEGFRECVEQALQKHLYKDVISQHMSDISEIIERLDFRWDEGFISKEKYVQKREQLQQEVSALRPIAYEKFT